MLADLDRVLRALEASLEKLDGVSTARIVTDGDGMPAEVHIISDGSKAPKQLVRDIQSVALAAHDVTLDHRIVSVVFLPGAGRDGAVVDRHRLHISGIGVHVSKQRYTVDVTLSSGDDEVAGAAVGPPTPAARPKLVAQATLCALERVYGAHDRLHLDAIEVCELSGHRVAAVVLVVLSTAGNPGEVVTGCSAVGVSGEDEAVVRAVLDATNRRLPHLFPELVLDP